MLIASGGVLMTVLLALCLWFGLVTSLIPMEIQDGFNGYRITGTVMYGVVGVLWAAFGLAVALSPRRESAAAAH